MALDPPNSSNLEQPALKGLRLSKVRARTGQTDSQTHRQTRPNALPTAFAGGNNIIVSLISLIGTSLLSDAITPLESHHHLLLGWTFAETVATSVVAAVVIRWPLFNSQATLPIWSAHTVSLARCGRPHLKFLSVPPHNLDTAARRFSVAAPRLWNSLTLNCPTAPSVDTFKTRLKTFLFVSA